MSVIQKYLEPQREREREIQRRKKEIMASKAGKVVSVNVDKGATVESGSVLCVIE